MVELMAKMRYFPDDALVPIREQDLKRIGRRYGVDLAVEEIKGQGARILPGDILVEETREVPIGKATQTIVTVEAGNEESFRRCVRELIDTYRGPVPIWGLSGSTERAEAIANELLDQDDGW